LIASILTAEPQPISAIQPMTPVTFDRVVRTCLLKDPDERWQSAHDIAAELRWIGQPVADTKARRNAGAWIAGAIIAALLVATGIFGYLWRRATAAPSRRIEASILPPENNEFLFTTAPALSPDGSRLAFVTTSKVDSKTRLWVRDLESGAVQELATSVSSPFWSPDSRSLAFFDMSERKLKRIDVAGGPPQIITDFSGRSVSGTWNDKGVIVFTPGGRHGLSRVPATGGSAVELTKLDPAHESAHRWPSFLPDGKHFLYVATTFGSTENGRLYLGSLEGGDRKLIALTNLPAFYSRTGHLLYCRDNALVMQPFDLKHLELRDDAVVVADRVYSFNLAGSAAFSVSANGVLAFVRGSGERSRFVWHDRAGKQTGIVGEPGDYQRPALSHDGRHLAYELYGPDGKADIWIYDMLRNTATRFTSDSGSETNSVWSPDDRYLVYAAEDVHHGTRDIVRRDTSGGGSPEKLFAGNGLLALTDWSADGRFIIFHDGMDIYCYSIPDRKAFPVVQTPFNDLAGRLSPDGHWLAYGSDQSGHSEIYVQPFPNPTSVTKISINGGTQPRWTLKGREIVYETLDRKVIAVDVQPGTTFDAGVPKELFSYQFKPGGWPLDVTADGQKFLVNESVRDESQTPITLVLNFSVPK
jgi:Tol biopolymer transport system component